MNITRNWVTPLAMSAFMLMAVTGVLMFFHLDTGLNKAAHEWFSWLFLAGIGMHVFANRAGFKRHFAMGKKAMALLSVSAMVIAASFFSPPQAENQRPELPAADEMSAVAHAPVSRIAALTDKPLEQVMRELDEAGLGVASADQSLAQALGHNARLHRQAFSVIFSGAHY